MDYFDESCKKLGYKKFTKEKIYYDDSFFQQILKSPEKPRKSKYFVIEKPSNVYRNYNHERLDELLKFIPNIDRTPLLLNDISRIDSKIAQNIKNGLIKYDDKIDLHGYQINEAFDLFMSFIKHNFILNRRFLLVVTGFGHPNNADTIKNNLIRWVLGRRDLNNILSYFGFAHIRNGGEGAFCIYLSKCKIDE